MVEGSDRFRMPPTRGFQKEFTHNDEFPARKVRRYGYKNTLNRKRTYMKTSEDNLYNFVPREPQESVSPYLKALHVPHVERTGNHGYKLKYDTMFHQTANRPKPMGPRKGMIIDEREKTPMKRNYSDLHRREELPGNLFLDNIRQQDIDWNVYRKVTWKDILTSYRKDLGVRHLPYVQSTRHKEEWLRRIEERVAHTRNEFDTRPPHVSPRLFHPNSIARQQRAVGSYETKDGMGTIYTLVGPEDYSKREYKPVVYEGKLPRIHTPKSFDF